MESMESMGSSKSMESADWLDERDNKRKSGAGYGEDYGGGEYDKDYDTDNRE